MAGGEENQIAKVQSTLATNNDSFIEELVTKYLGGQQNGISDAQRTVFLEVCKVNNLNPFKKEVHAVPFWDDKNKRYDLQPVTSYHVYLERANATGLLDGWDVQIDRDDKGVVTGGVITIYRKDWTNPFRWYVDFEEAVIRNKTTNAPTGLRKGKPAFMLKKVLISQGMRMCLPEATASLPYEQDEIPTGEDTKAGMDANATSSVQGKNVADLSSGNGSPSIGVGTVKTVYEGKKDTVQDVVADVVATETPEVIEPVAEETKGIDFAKHVETPTQEAPAEEVTEVAPVETTPEVAPVVEVPTTPPVNLGAQAVVETPTEPVQEPVPAEEKQAQPKQPTITDEQRKQIFRLWGYLGYVGEENEDKRKLAMDKLYNVTSLTLMDKTQASDFITVIKRKFVERIVKEKAFDGKLDTVSDMLDEIYDPNSGDDMLMVNDITKYIMASK